MKCPHCNKEIDTSDISETNKNPVVEKKKDPFAPSEQFAKMCKPTKNSKEGF